jgi:hypothetical protein
LRLPGGTRIQKDQDQGADDRCDHDDAQEQADPKAEDAAPRTRWRLGIRKFILERIRHLLPTVNGRPPSASAHLEALAERQAR